MNRFIVFLAGFALGVVGLYLFLFSTGVLTPYLERARNDSAPQPSVKTNPTPAPQPAPQQLPPPPNSADRASIPTPAPLPNEPNVTLPPPPPSPDDQVSPIQGLTRADLHDTFEETHNGHRHEAIDLIQPQGTPVHAMVAGTIQKLFLSKPGGNTIYEFDDAGVYCYYYAHLDRYDPSVHEGMHVARGDVIGYVGSTGNADPGTPHLHFEIHQLGPDKHWWQGMPLNPYPILMRIVSR